MLSTTQQQVNENLYFFSILSLYRIIFPQVADREIVNLQDLLLSVDPEAIENRDEIDALINEANKTSHVDFYF